MAILCINKTLFVLPCHHANKSPPICAPRINVSCQTCVNRSLAAFLFDSPLLTDRSLTPRGPWNEERKGLTLIMSVRHRLMALGDILLFTSLLHKKRAGLLLLLDRCPLSSHDTRSPRIDSLSRPPFVCNDGDVGMGYPRGREWLFSLLSSNPGLPN